MKRKSETHRRRMAARRECQLARTPGFTAGPNRRHERRRGELGEMVLAEQARLDPVNRLDARETHSEALRRLIAGLPQAPFGRKLAPLKPTKNNDPAYRKCAG